MTAHVRAGSSRPTPVKRVSSVPPAIERAVAKGAFDVEKYINSFELLASAAGGVEGLRALVLHLAIRGQLVGYSPQQESKCPVSEGLTPPFGLPVHWAWRRVDEVGEVKLGRQRAPENHNGPYMRPYLRVANVFEARIDTSDILEMNFTPDEVERFILKPNDILLNEGQSYELVGRPAIYRGEVPGACFQNTLIRFRIHKQVSAEFALVVFRAYMRTGRFRREAQQTTNIAHLSAGRLSAIEFPLPPLAEQKRIVARVDQLMALIDDLEQKQTRKRQLSANFTKASLEALTTAETPEDFDSAWKCVVENWGVVVDRAEKVAAIRAAMLEAAIRGRLRRDTSARLTASSTGRQLSPIPEAEIAQRLGSLGFAIPQGWIWARLDSLAEQTQSAICAGPFGTIFKAKDFRSEGIPIIFLRHVGPGQYRTHKPGFMDRKKWKEMFQPYSVWGGELLVTKLGDPPGVCAIYPEAIGPAMVTPDVIKMSVDPTLAVPKYLMFYLNAETSRRLAFDAAYGLTRARMNLPIFRSIPVPLPPLAEQKRIVAKVDHLMKLCDELEAKLRRSEDRASNLVEAVVQEMVG